MNSIVNVLHSIATNILSKPGDKLTAIVTPSQKQVLKIVTDNVKRTAVRYPTGTIVETIVRKCKS